MASTILFIKNAFKKFFETILSVKIWILISVFYFSDKWLSLGFINGSEASTLLITVITAIIGMREAFKTSRIKDR